MVLKQYPKANQSVIQKAKYESQNLNVIRTPKKLRLRLSIKNSKII